VNDASSTSDQDSVHIVDVSRCRVLVVDDNSMNRMMISKLIKEKLGVAHVDVAEDGQQALDMCRAALAAPRLQQQAVEPQPAPSQEEEEEDFSSLAMQPVRPAAAALPAQRQYYDAIFMDLTMPEMDGWDATRHIRAAERASGGALRARIIALSGNVMGAEVDRATACGADAFLAKPSGIAALLKELCQAV
jgi:CheY-like chemotaxis protein